MVDLFQYFVLDTAAIVEKAPVADAADTTPKANNSHSAVRRKKVWGPDPRGQATKALLFAA